MVFGNALLRLKELEAISIPVGKESIPSIEPTILDKWGITIFFVDKELEMNASIESLLTLDSPLGLDIETYPKPEHLKDPEGGLNPYKSEIRTIQLFDGISTVYVFDLKRLGYSPFIGNPLWEKPMVAHNALFEMKHLVQKGILPKKLGCTLIADRILYGNRIRLKKELNLSISATLKDLSQEYLNIDISKELQVSDWSSNSLSKEQLEYAALDAVIPNKLFHKQKDLLKKQNLNKSYEILRDAQSAITHMELSGIGFDVLKHKHLIDDWNCENESIKKEILDILGIELNLNSGKQLGEWLNESLEQKDLEKWTKTSKGKLSTSTPTFKINEKLHLIFPKIIEYRHLAKKISAYGEGLYKYIANGRLYASFTLGLTSTGRMSSIKPNLQNMPRTGFRDLFIAKEGYVLIGLDYSQQELRVAALVTKDKELLRIYAEGGDVHTNTAAAILNIPKEQVIKEQRQLAKAVIFGLLYGQGAKGLAIYAKQQYGVSMTEAEAETHRKNLFKTYKGLRTWQKDIGNLVKITGTIRTQSGRLRDFNREAEGYRYSAALNHPIQGAAAEITLRAMTKLTSLLCKDCILVNVIHDEILLEVKESRAHEFAEKAQEIMEAAFVEIFPNAKPYLKGLVEAKIGKNWSETK